MEVFVAYTKDDSYAALETTLIAWDEIDDIEVKGIEVDHNNFEMARRIVADGLAEGEFYILADIGCVPQVLQNVEREFGEELGLAGFGAGDVPTGVRFIRKGVVNKWPKQVSATYDAEHARAVREAGKRVELWPELAYTRVLVN